MSDLIDLVGELVGRPVTIDPQDERAGDVQRTGGAIERAADLLGWRPSVSVRDGVAAQLEWLRHRRRASDR